MPPLGLRPRTRLGLAHPPLGRPTAARGEVIEACLRKNGGVIERTFRELGLKNRCALMRLIKKHGITPPQA